jgi:tRNASer (uridine44-2'-O)-methyltransferase
LFANNSFDIHTDLLAIQFFDTLAELCLHPERNSTNILRADIVYDDAAVPATADKGALEERIKHCKYIFVPPAGYRRTRSIRRRILPRRPTRDAPLLQDCAFYRSDSDTPSEEQGILVMVPHADTREDVPYYHPVLRKIAFRYKASPPLVVAPTIVAVTDSAPLPDEQPEVKGTISISILPFSDELASTTSDVPDEQLVSSDVLPNRTYRTCLHLLETLHKHGWGRLTGYQKRVIHDVRLIHWSYAYIHVAFWILLAF